MKRKRVETVEESYQRRLEAFEKFDRDNPRVWALFQHFAGIVIREGYSRYSARAIFHRVRWHVNIETKRADRYKINNNHSKFYALKWLAANPERATFFGTRASPSEG